MNCKNCGKKLQDSVEIDNATCLDCMKAEMDDFASNIIYSPFNPGLN